MIVGLESCVPIAVSAVISLGNCAVLPDTVESAVTMKLKASSLSEEI